MSRVTRASNHLSSDEVLTRREQATSSWHRRAWDVVYTALVDPRIAQLIARQLGVSRAFVSRTITRYNRLGPDQFLGPGKGGRRNAYLTPEQETALLQPLLEQAAAGDLTTVAAVQDALEYHLGHSVDESTVYRLLARHTWRKVFPRPRHPKADTHRQQEWKRTLPDLVAEAVASRSPDDTRPVLLVAQDEGRFGRISEPQACWAPAPCRPVVAQQIVRQSVYVFAAVAPELGQMVSLILPSANTDMMNVFLEHVSLSLQEYFLVMQLDGARWHDSHALVVPENIRLLLQPPYSPELNPVEKIWRHVRKHTLRNTYAKTLDAVIEMLTDGLHTLGKQADVLRSLTNAPHFRMISLNAS
jgi:transposase